MLVLFILVFLLVYDSCLSSLLTEFYLIEAVLAEGAVFASAFGVVVIVSVTLAGGDMY